MEEFFFGLLLFEGKDKAHNPSNKTLCRARRSYGLLRPRVIIESSEV